MLISYMTKMMLMFSGIIAVGLLLTWVNDRLEQLLVRLSFTRHLPVRHSKMPVQYSSRYSYPGKSTPPKSYVLASVTPQPVVTNMAEKLVTSKPAPEPAHHDYASKIVKIDLAPRSRATQDEHGDRLGEHVTVLPKAA
jgi:hypothetical protein